MRWIFFSLLLFLSVQVNAKTSYEQAVSNLSTASIKTLSVVVDELAKTKDSRAIETLEALEDGRLFTLKSDKTIVVQQIAKDEAKKTIQIQQLLAPEKTEWLTKKKLSKIRINNKLRGLIAEQLSQLKLFSKDLDTRKTAVNDFISSPDEGSRRLLNDALSVEQPEEIKEDIEIALASLDALITTDKAKQLNAVTALGESKHMETFFLLERLKATMTPSADNEALLTAIDASMSNIESRKKRYRLIENTFFGLSLGSVLLLAAIGLAITFGVMGVINMAHGEMIMIGAYTTFVVQSLMPNMIEYSIWVAIPVAFLTAALVGILIERLVIRHLYGRPLETLLATFGISLVLQQAARSIFGPLNQSVITPDWMSGSLEFNPMLSLTYNRIYILIFSLIVFFGLVLLLKKTSIGLYMRAVTQNREMANSMGIRSSRVDALTFGLGSGIAGLAGVAISQLNNVGPNLGQSYIIDSFMVVVFGGSGNIFGTLYAAFGLGIINKFIEPYSGAVLAKIMILVFIILFIQWRPRGMFAVKGRFVED